jgi:diguanylate cyclase (GGDEF)-like protein
MSSMARRVAGTHSYWCAIEDGRVVDASTQFRDLHGALDDAAALWIHHPDLGERVDEASALREPFRTGPVALGATLTEFETLLVFPDERRVERIYLAGVPSESPSRRAQRQELARWRSDLADIISAPLPQIKRINGCLSMLVRYAGARHVMLVEWHEQQARVINGATPGGHFGFASTALAARFEALAPDIALEAIDELPVTLADASGALSVVYPLVNTRADLRRLLIVDGVHPEREGSVLVMINAVGNWVGNILQAADEVRYAQQRDRLYAEVVRAMSDAVLVMDASLKVIQGNEAAARLTGMPVAAMAGRHVSELMVLTTSGGEAMRWDKVATGARPVMIEPTTCELPHLESLTLVKGSCVRFAGGGEGEADTLVAVLHDVSHEIEHMRRAEWEATHDSLTGLHNRAGFERAVSALKGGGQMICIDLDRFKIINDTCGHAAGDEVLSAVATLMRKQVRRVDVLGRIGGDEFFIALPECPEPVALRIAESIREAIAEYAYRDASGELFRISASIGVSAYAEGDLLQRRRADADAAMYSAKRSGKNRVVVFDHSPDAMTHLSDAHWAHRIERAIEDGRIELWRQPIVDLQESRGRGYEVLVRMRDENGALVGAGEFIPAAERYDLIGRLDRHIIEQVAMHFEDVVHGGRYVSVNISGRSISDASLVDWIIGCFDAACVNPHQVCIELTETAAVADHEVALKLMDKLREAGFLIALDDLGSGVASFASLRRLPVDIVKLDGAYVRDVIRDEGAQNILRAVVQVAQAYGIDTVAEWIEDAQTVAWVSSAGITRGQGYFLGAPEPVELALTAGRTVLADAGACVRY